MFRSIERAGGTKSSNRLEASAFLPFLFKRRTLLYCALKSFLISCEVISTHDEYDADTHGGAMELSCLAALLVRFSNFIPLKIIH